MKYSLRSLMVVVLVLPVLVYSVAAVWTYVFMVNHYNQPRMQVLCP